MELNNISFMHHMSWPWLFLVRRPSVLLKTCDDYTFTEYGQLFCWTRKAGNGYKKLPKLVRELWPTIEKVDLDIKLQLFFNLNKS